MPGSSFLFVLNLMALHEIQGSAQRKRVVMLKKLCSYPGCHKVVETGVKYCNRHKDTDREKYRAYKQQRMKDNEEARRQQFYNNKAWELFRAAQAAAQIHIDIYEYYTTGRIVDAENYHHIQEITEAWDRRLEQGNVIGLTEANHRRIHTEYERSYKAKRKMQITLSAMLERFYREFVLYGGI